MADKAISELISAERVTEVDCFVLEQNGVAKSLMGRVLKNWLLELAQGHGGITSIALQSTSGLNKTYRITLADDTFFDMTVADGKGITSVEKTSTVGLVDTYTMSFNAGSDFVFSVKNGDKGDKGDADRLYFKFASQKPTDTSHDMGDIPDEWLGFYAGTTPPSGWQDYTWVRIKGDKGDKGDAAKLTSHSTTYMVSDSGTIVPSGSWVADVPNVPQGKYLWTRTVLTFNTGNPVTSYSVSRFGLDGTGAVNSVNGKDPDPTGNVRVNAEDITTSNGTSVQAALDAAVKTVNGKEADGTGSVVLDAADVGARPDTWTPTAADVGALPTAGGTMAGAIDMAGNGMKNLPLPAEDGDPLIKSQVVNSFATTEPGFIADARTVAELNNKSSEKVNFKTYHTGGNDHILLRFEVLKPDKLMLFLFGSYNTDPFWATISSDDNRNLCYMLSSKGSEQIAITNEGNGVYALKIPLTLWSSICAISTDNFKLL